MHKSGSSESERAPQIQIQKYLYPEIFSSYISKFQSLASRNATWKSKELKCTSPVAPRAFDGGSRCVAKDLEINMYQGKMNTRTKLFESMNKILRSGAILPSENKTLLKLNLKVNYVRFFRA